MRERERERERTCGYRKPDYDAHLRFVVKDTMEGVEDVPLPAADPRHRQTSDFRSSYPAH